MGNGEKITHVFFFSCKILPSEFCRAGLVGRAKELQETKNREQFLVFQYGNTTPELVATESADGKTFTVARSFESMPSFHVGPIVNKYRYGAKDAKEILKDLWWFHPHKSKTGVDAKESVLTK